jgi:hypothetical protein
MAQELEPRRGRARESAADRPRWFGRALHLTPRRRIAEVWYDVAYRGGWPARLARLLGFQGPLVVTVHSLSVSRMRRAVPAIRVAFASGGDWKSCFR